LHHARENLPHLFSAFTCLLIYVSCGQGKSYRYFYGYTGFAFGAKAGPWALPDTPAVLLAPPSPRTPSTLPQLSRPSPSRSCSLVFTPSTPATPFYRTRTRKQTARTGACAHTHPLSSLLVSLTHLSATRISRTGPLSRRKSLRMQSRGRVGKSRTGTSQMCIPPSLSLCPTLPARARMTACCFSTLTMLVNHVRRGGAGGGD
jgi:hypothetical protein